MAATRWTHHMSRDGGPGGEADVGEPPCCSHWDSSHINQCHTKIKNIVPKLSKVT